MSIDQESGCTKPLGDLGKEIWRTAEAKGFHDPVDIATLERSMRLLLIVGEISEALEALRKGDEAHHNEEIADTVIRLLHYAVHEGIDIDAEVLSKMDINRGRPHKHGKKF